jgi:hypothetical protein
MSRSRPSIVPVVIALWCLAPDRTTAQLSISPAIGVYIPTSELVKAASGQQFKQEVSITLGGRVGLNFGRRAGIEATVDYAPSKLKFSATGTDTTGNADILSASGRLFLELLPPANPVSLQLNGGAGVVRRTGTAYQGDPDNSDVGGVVGATLRFRLGRLLHLQLHGEDFVYKAKYAPNTTGGGFSVVDKQLNDIHLSVGVGIPLLGMGGGDSTR